jgi:pimeloyl-ACP methyl ester carboxylesterase
MSERKPAAKNVVHIHGAWADGSSWMGVIERLQKDDFKVTAAQTPMDSLPDDVSRVRRLLSMQNGPTIVAGHSFGAPNVRE